MSVDVSSRLAGVEVSHPGAYLLVSDPLDIRWLTGFTGSTSRLVVSSGSEEAWLFVDGRYIERAHAEVEAGRAGVSVVECDHGESAEDAMSRVLGRVDLIVDPGRTTVAMHARLGCDFAVVLGSSNIDERRRVKDGAELALIARAAEIADAALLAVVGDGLCGRTEREIRDRLDMLMRGAGADDVSFPTIVAAGVNGARPHHEPTETVVAPGDLVTIDMGSLVEGYHSDMTRTVMVGSARPDMTHLLDLVREAQEVAVSQVRTGVTGREIDRAARAVFESHDVGHEYVHGTGHGVGLAIHEKPILNARCETVLLDGEVVTVEPGLYRGGVGGARIEDLLVVTGGSRRSLTTSPKDLSCPPSPRMI